MSREILIFAKDNDNQSKLIYKKLSERWENVEIIDWSEYPQNINLSYKLPLRSQKDIVLYVNWKHIKSPKSIYWRNYSWPGMLDYNNNPFWYVWNTKSENRNLIYKNNTASIKSFFELFPNILWLNNPNSVYEHWMKPVQFDKISKNIKEFSFPKTFITNNFKDIERILSKTKKWKFILKPVMWWFYTRLLTKESFKFYKDIFYKNPCSIQEYIRWENIRVYVLWKKVYPIKIETKNIDFRTGDYKSTAITLPNNIKQACIKTAEILNYNFTWIDLIKTRKKYYFLEANPSPIFMKDNKDAWYNISEDILNSLSKWKIS